MSVYSMTGYASVVASVPDHVGENTEGDAPSRKVAGGVGAELRSVNSRFLDLSFKLPDEFRGLEPAFRDMLTAAFKRGKIELRLQPQRAADSAWPQPQPDQLHTLARLEGMVQNWLPKAQALSVNEVLNWCRNAAPAVKLEDAALEAVRQCVEALKEARQVEGGRLVGILLERLNGLRELAAQAAPLVPQAVQRQQERFLQRYQEALQAAGSGTGVSEEAARERALSEAAAYALRIDVDEEVQRLKAHLDEIERLLKKGGEAGKRLDFLIQELHREANTLGSKAASLELTQVSVSMKVLIEQMREQVQNIE